MAEIFIGRRSAFGVIAVEEAGRCLTFEHQGEFPGEIVAVLDAAIAAARAEGRHLMRGIAGKEHTALAESLEPAALKTIDADPNQLEGLIRAEHRPKTWENPLRAAFELGIGVTAELEIDAPNLVRLGVDEGRTAAIEGRVEPKAPLGGEPGVHLDIGDEKPVLE